MRSLRRAISLASLFAPPTLKPRCDKAQSMFADTRYLPSPSALLSLGRRRSLRSSCPGSLQRFKGRLLFFVFFFLVLFISRGAVYTMAIPTDHTGDGCAGGGRGRRLKYKSQPPLYLPLSLFCRLPGPFFFFFASLYRGMRR